MDYDEILETWRTQDETPLYGVNPELIAVVVRQDYEEMRRESGWDLWFVPIALWGAACAMLAVFVLSVFVTVVRGWATPDVWDYAAIGVGAGAILLWPVFYGLSFRRQLARERAFGKTLQDEIQRYLTRVDFHLSRHERLVPSLLMRAPFLIVAILFLWAILRINAGPFSARTILVIVAFSMLVPVFSAGGYFKQRLREQKRRLNRMLALLNAGDEEKEP